jgi:hypothetical protein
MNKPVIDRPEIQELLAQLKSLDREGWCGITDGSFDDEPNSSVELTIQYAMNYILSDIVINK